MERILVLYPFWALRCFHAAIYLAVVFIRLVPHRYPMAIPDLAGYAPVAQIFYPVEIYAFEMFRHYLYFSIPYRLEHEFFEGFVAARRDFFIDFHEPLEHYLRFNYSAGAFRGGHPVLIVLIHGHQKTFLL